MSLHTDLQGIFTVDEPGFCAVLEQFNSWYQLLTCKHFTKVAVTYATNMEYLFPPHTRDTLLDFVSLCTKFGVKRCFP